MTRRQVFRGQGTKTGFQRHHLIPVSVCSSGHFADQFDMVRQATGFDPADFRANGIFLPCTENAALASGRPLHRGPHRKYNDIVEQRVAAIFRYKARSKADIVIQHRLLTNLQMSLFQSLSSNSQNIILNRRDPMARHVDFRSVDEDLATLWSVTAPSS